MRIQIHQRFLNQIIIVFILSISLNNYVYAESDRAKRPFARIISEKVRLNVPVPARPEWNYIVEPREGTYALLISSPEKFYPQVSMEIVLNHRIKVKPNEFETIAINSLNSTREKSGINEKIVKADLTYVTYSGMHGYQDSYEIESKGKTYSVKSILGIMASGHPITIFIATPKGQMEHIQDISTKIFNNIKELH